MTDLVHSRAIDDVWDILIEVYAEVRADQLHIPHYSVERYAERLARHGKEFGWEAVVAYEDGTPVGYGYVNSLVPVEDRWWKRTTPAPEETLTGLPTVAIKEMMVTQPYRRQGIARKIHDALLSEREEVNASLMVSPANQDGRVQALYASWGYEAIGRSQSTPDAPPLTVMIRPVGAHEQVRAQRAAVDSAEATEC
ncbi:GNAT family N-acetyltransferase [Streptomyces endophyticus]|uniref:GNAT family N-acetyltransferase n=1 Tax=Streptomyces endophyticus TaxID=714166 RepID=A0ABU6FA85_9ACTN|nr:GNAT family N-acetyltransferase [Streptomyces endophyticus]MEB8339766.1 GNAT family N-acetyltransferase [Streptomyces endophyticus]